MPHPPSRRWVPLARVPCQALAKRRRLDPAHGVAELGCGLALDDFGTGFGSFTYLKKLPVTHLKIDMEFVRDLVTNEANLRVVRVIVGLARAFGLRTVAEGVEDEETLQQLRAEGVDYAQGYHIGRPGPM